MAKAQAPIFWGLLVVSTYNHLGRYRERLPNQQCPKRRSFLLPQMRRKGGKMPIIYTDKVLPERAISDFYQTPQPVVDVAIERFGQLDARSILDIGAADGRWGTTAAKFSGNLMRLVGVDIRLLPAPAGFDFWHRLDYSFPIYCETMPVKEFDFIVSNPPFSVAEAIIWNAWEQLKPGGKMLFLLSGDFWYSAGRHNGLWRLLPPAERCSVVKRIPFTKNGNPNNYDLYLWIKDKKGQPVGKPNETRNTQITF